MFNAAQLQQLNEVLETFETTIYFACGAEITFPVKYAGVLVTVKKVGNQVIFTRDPDGKEIRRNGNIGRCYVGVAEGWNRKAKFGPTKARMVITENEFIIEVPAKLALPTGITQNRRSKANPSTEAWKAQLVTKARVLNGLLERHVGEVEVRVVGGRVVVGQNVFKELS